MLIEECKGCNYMWWGVGIGFGVRCTHPDHRTENSPPIPIIADLENCKKYKPRVLEEDKK